MSGNKLKHTDTDNFPGDRLSTILDQIGFKKGRGRVLDFQNYLRDASPKDFKDLKYTTVRAWFQCHAPPMRKIDAVIDALQIEFQFHHDISHIKTWWKVGGPCPFSNETTAVRTSIQQIQQKIELQKEKLMFIIISIVKEETGEHFNSLSGSDLTRIYDKVTSFVEDFLNPSVIECPDEYLRLVARHELERILNEDA
jgi:signal recognition particle subunit SEC65